jgi:hypothetical protein
MNWTVFVKEENQSWVEEFTGLAGSGKSYYYEHNVVCKGYDVYQAHSSARHAQWFIEACLYLLLFVPIKRYTNYKMVARKYLFVRRVYQEQQLGLIVEEGLAHFMCAYFYSKKRSKIARNMHYRYVRSTILSNNVQPIVYVLGHKLSPETLLARRTHRGRGLDCEIGIVDIQSAEYHMSLAILDFDNLFEFDLKYI